MLWGSEIKEKIDYLNKENSRKKKTLLKSTIIDLTVHKMHYTMAHLLCFCVLTCTLRQFHIEGQWNTQASYMCFCLFQQSIYYPFTVVSGL